MKASLRSRFRIFLVPGRLHHCPLLLQHHGFAWWGPLCKWNDRAHALESSLFCPQCPETPVRVLVYSKTCSLSLPDGACMMYQCSIPTGGPWVSPVSESKTSWHRPSGTSAVCPGQWQVCKARLQGLLPVVLQCLV